LILTIGFNPFSIDCDHFVTGCLKKWHFQACKQLHDLRVSAGEHSPYMVSPLNARFFCRDDRGKDCCRISGLMAGLFLFGTFTRKDDFQHYGILEKKNGK